MTMKVPVAAVIWAGQGYWQLVLVDGSIERWEKPRGGGAYRKVG